MKVTTTITLIVALVAIAISAYTLGTRDSMPETVGREKAHRLPPPPEDSSVPSPGTFAIRWLPDHEAPAPIPGIRSGSGAYPKVAYFQVDYAGPKKFLELYIENSLDGEHHSQEVVHREVFGAADMTRKGTTSSFREGAPHSRPRQFFLVRAYYVDAPDDWCNMLFSVFSCDAEERGFWSADQGTGYAVRFDKKLNQEGGYGSRAGWISHQANKQTGGYVGPKNPLQDSESVELMRDYRGKAESALKLRFVDQ